MAIIGTITQQPVDVLDYDIDVTALVEGGDAIASVVATVTPSGELEVSPIETSDTLVKLWIGPDGVAGTTYKIEVTVTTDNGRIKQDELRVKIKEV
jgi:hypothetical protein